MLSIPTAVIRILPLASVYLVRRWHTSYLGGESRQDPKRILERDVDMITVRAYDMADRVRTPVQPQLQCVGGSARRFTSLQPREMQCATRGVDDMGNLNWIWEVRDLDKRVRVERVDVSFEGWDGPGDRYVRAGSAVVRYQLIKARGIGTLVLDEREWTLVVAVVVVLVLFIILLAVSRRPAQTVLVSSGSPAPSVRVRHYRSDPSPRWTPEPSDSSSSQPSYTPSSTRTETGYARSTRSE